MSSRQIRKQARRNGALAAGTKSPAGIQTSSKNAIKHGLTSKMIVLTNESQARFDGVDLGSPVHLRENPTIGDVPLPARGILAIGGAVWEILDQAEYERTRSETV